MFNLKIRNSENNEENYITHYDKIKNALILTKSDLNAQQYLSLETLQEEIQNLLTNNPKEIQDSNQLIIEFETQNIKTYQVYYSEDFGKTWEKREAITVNDITKTMNAVCNELGDDWFYDENLRIAYNDFGQTYAYLNVNETESDLKNKRIVEE